MRAITAWLQDRAAHRRQRDVLARVGIDDDVVGQLLSYGSVHIAAAIELAKAGVRNGRLVEFADAVVWRVDAKGVSLDQAVLDLAFLSAMFGDDQWPMLLNNVAEHFRRQYESTTPTEKENR